MSDQNFSAIRARLRYETMEDFVEGYSRFISSGGMFVPMKPSRLKPVGTTLRFQFLLGDGTTALLGEGVVLQVRSPDPLVPAAPVGMLIKFTKLSQESKILVDQIVVAKGGEVVVDDRTPVPVGFNPVELTRESASEVLESAPVVAKPAEVSSEESDFDAFFDAFKASQSTASDSEPESAVSDFSSDSESPVLSDSVGMESDVQEDGPQESPAFLEPEAGFEPSGFDVESGFEIPEFSVPSESFPAAVEEQIVEPAPEAETPTREAPVVESAGPVEIARTAGGLQILAFDEIEEEAARALEGFSFGDADEDIDGMFDELFGGDLFGDAQGPAQDMSVEFALPEEPDVLSEAPVDVSVPEEPVDVSVPEEVESELVEESEDFLLEEPVRSSLDFAEVFESSKSEGFESSIEASGVEKLGVAKAESGVEVSGEASGVEDLGVVGVESGVEASEAGGFAEADLGIEVEEFKDVQSERHEITSLLAGLDESEPEELSLNIGTVAQSKYQEEESDAESLDALLASARRELDERSPEEPKASGDLIDELFGSELPPPPADGPVFEIPVAKKKKGFFSRLFDD